MNVTTTTTAPSLGLAALQAASASALPASAGAAASSATANSASSAALTKLGSNFNEFLNLLLTQLKNQDPTSPMDTNQFTTELVQFTGVQQQASTNSSLTQLIGLTQQNQLLQSSQYIGHRTTVQAGAIALQDGSGSISFQGQAGQPVAIAIVDATGAPLRDVTLTAQDGLNQWSWDGHDDSGNAVPDGAYRIAVESEAQGGAPTALPFSVIGTTTSVSSNGTAGLQLNLGALPVSLADVQAVAQ